MPPLSTNISKRRLAYSNLVADAHSKWCNGTGTHQDSAALDIQLLSLGHNAEQITDLRKPPHPFVSCASDTEAFDLTQFWRWKKRKRSDSSLAPPPVAPRLRHFSFPRAPQARDFEEVPRRAEESLRRARRSTSEMDVVHPNCANRSVIAIPERTATTTRPKGDAANDVRARRIPSNVRFWSGDQAIPAFVSHFVAKVKGVKRGERGFPVRRALRVLSNEHIEQSYGTLRSTSSLLEFFGDTRLFSAEMWRYLYLPGAPGRK